MKPISYSQTFEFNKDFKKLLKRFRTLEEDFENMKKSAIEIYHLIIETNHIVRIQDYCSQDYLSMKVRKMACKSLKGKGVQSGLRVIYVLNKKRIRLLS
jgi:predicted DNA-binding transcriptional regulator